MDLFGDKVNEDNFVSLSRVKALPLKALRTFSVPLKENSMFFKCFLFSFGILLVPGFYIPL